MANGEVAANSVLVMGRWPRAGHIARGFGTNKVAGINLGEVLDRWTVGDCAQQFGLWVDSHTESCRRQ